MADHNPGKSARDLAWSGIPVERHASLWSTSGEARERIHRGGLAEATVIVAATQTGAYGRRGRAWQAPSGGLWWTLAYPWAAAEPSDASEAHDAEGLGLRVGAACLEMVTAALGKAGVGRDRITLKWPNDVLVDGRKALGCLCERVIEGAGAGRIWLVVGVGLNANNDPEELGESLRRPPTSLRAIAGHDFDLEALGSELTAHILGALAKRSRMQWTEELQQIAARLDGIDGPITLRLPGGPGGGMLRGTLAGLSDTGRLVVNTEHGRVVAPPGAEFSAAQAQEGTDSR